MSIKFKPLKAESASPKTSLRAYITGFMLSIILTLIAFGLTQKHTDSGHIWGTHNSLILAVMVLAFIQLAVQLIFFLHLAREPKPRLQSIMFVFSFVIIVIVVVGTLWIMANLDYSHGASPHENMTSTEIDKAIIEDEIGH